MKMSHMGNKDMADMYMNMNKKILNISHESPSFQMQKPEFYGLLHLK